MTIMDGKAVARSWKEEMQSTVEMLTDFNYQPCLAVVSVGDDAASQVYVRNKKKACEEMNIKFIEKHLAADCSPEELVDAITSLNEDKSVNGIILQLPLPSQLDENYFINHIDPIKDVDGLTAFNQGYLAQMEVEQFYPPCTPLGIGVLLTEYGLRDLAGKHVVIVGRSKLVGKPLMQLLLQKDATVTVCHSKTADLASFTRQADVLIVAVGKPKFITADMVKPGAAVVDVGINRVDGKLCGDVDFDAVKEVAEHITPVPGGVGAMTVAALIYNTVGATLRQSLERSEEDEAD